MLAPYIDQTSIGYAIKKIDELSGFHQPHVHNGSSQNSGNVAREPTESPWREALLNKIVIG